MSNEKVSLQPVLDSEHRNIYDSATANRLQPCGNCTFPQNFDSRKFGEKIPYSDILRRNTSGDTTNKFQLHQ